MLSLKTHFYNAIEKLENYIAHGSYAVGQFLTDPHYLDIHPKETAGALACKVAVSATKAKKSFQKSTLKLLTTKNAAGDYAPKPTGRIVMGLAQEGMYIAGKFSTSIAPSLPRVMTSPALIGIAFAGAALYLAYDDTARIMMTEQLGNMMAVFQNDQPNEITDDSIATIPAETPKNQTRPDFKRPNYYV